MINVVTALSCNVGGVFFGGDRTVGVHCTNTGNNSCNRSIAMHDNDLVLSSICEFIVATVIEN